VSAVAKESVPALLWRLWRDPAAWSTTADIFVILIAVSLPWSTSLVAIFAAALLVSMAPFLDIKALLQSLKRPICALPIALFALAVVGTLWSNASWGERLYAVGPTVKLLMLPVLLYHFERSARGMWVFAAFLVSCSLLSQGRIAHVMPAESKAAATTAKIDRGNSEIVILSNAVVTREPRSAPNPAQPFRR
jgi:O-antigen ligase